MILKHSGNLPRGQTAPPFFRVWGGRVRTPRSAPSAGAGARAETQNLGFRGRGEQSSVLCKTGRWSIQSRPPQARESIHGPRRCAPHTPRHPQGQNSDAEGPVVHAFVLVTQTCSRVLSPQRPRAARGTEHQRSGVAINPPGCALPA